MADVVKWLTHQIVALAFVGSIPIVRPKFIIKAFLLVIDMLFLMLFLYRLKNLFVLVIKTFIYYLFNFIDEKEKYIADNI